MGRSIQQKRVLSFFLITVAGLFSIGMLWQAGSPELWKIGQQENSGLVIVPTNQILNLAGRRLEVANRVVDIAFSDEGDDDKGPGVTSILK